MNAQVNCDYLLLIVDTGETSDGVIPGKLFEYVAAKRPSSHSAILAPRSRSSKMLAWEWWWTPKMSTPVSTR